MAVVLGFFALGCGVTGAAMMWLLASSQDQNFPRRADLVELEGIVRAITSTGDEVQIALEGQARSVRYGKKSGNLDVVALAVLPGVNAEFLVRAAPRDSSAALSAYAVRVNGRDVRSFEDVERNWRRDNDAIRNILGPLFLAFGALLSIAFFATAIYEQRIDSR